MPPLPPPPPPPPITDPPDQSESAVPPVPPVPPVDAPPKRGKASSGASSKVTGGTAGTGAGRAPRKAPLEKKLEELFSSPALLFSFTGDEYAAQIIATRTPAMAAAWYELSKQNAGVKRILERLTEGSAWGAVFLSTASVVVPLAQHFGALPGADPFSVIYGQPDAPDAGPIVPPPPPSNPTTVVGGETGGQGGTPSMSPPVGDHSPPGVVTVAGLAAAGAYVQNGGGAE